MSAYGETLSADQVATTARVERAVTWRVLEWLADEDRIRRDGQGYRY